GLGKDGEEDGGENGDDCDHHQQLDQREAGGAARAQVSAGGPKLAHRSPFHGHGASRRGSGRPATSRRRKTPLLPGWERGANGGSAPGPAAAAGPVAPGAPS